MLHDEKGEEIGPVIKNGRPQGGMPGFPSLSQDDLYNISQYLHLQVELAANRGTYGATYGALRNEVSGDAGKGRTVLQWRRRLRATAIPLPVTWRKSARSFRRPRPCNPASYGLPRQVGPR